MEVGHSNFFAACPNFFLRAPPTPLSADDSASRSDTTAPGGAQPVQGQSGKIGSEIAGGNPSSGDIPPPTDKGGESAA
jgi:hypothetical protein